tara:strand:- start:494 stop:652 length:159 start_codon:yes stop_codon:yes gene_type:complete
MMQQLADPIWTQSMRPNILNLFMNAIPGEECNMNFGIITLDAANSLKSIEIR